MQIVISCEHALSSIPPEYKYLFSGAGKVLNSHRGYDSGAFFLAEKISRKIKADLFAARFSRLLIDANRSLTNRSVFSKYTKALNPQEKKAVMDRYYTPYRQDVEKCIKKYFKKNRAVLHVSVHSFTPVLNGVKRTADIGILYDPAVMMEKKFAGILQKELKHMNPQLSVRKNYPYRGTSDGFTKHLRKQFKKKYAGIELEINQKHLKEGKFNSYIEDAILSVFELLKKMDEKY